MGIPCGGAEIIFVMSVRDERREGRSTPTGPCQFISDGGDAAPASKIV